MKSTRMVSGTLSAILRSGEQVSDRQEVVQRALAYPYRLPSHSFLQVGDRTLDLPLAGFDARKRTALLAFGSNASPEVLARKLGDSDPEVPVPVVRATLKDFDIVYSAHISPYGSVPAALQMSPGTEPLTFVIYLTGEQLRLMSETEPNYDLILLHDVSCQLESGDSLGTVASYMSRHGCLTLDDTEVALASVEARSRQFPSMSEPEVLERVKAIFDPDQDMDSFVADNVGDEELARQRTGILREKARPFAWPHWKALGT